MPQKYSVNQHLIETLLAWVKSGEIAIPEIQRPFVWDASQVRDLLDSLYQGYPIGYIIAWKNPTVKLKDGSLSEGKKILVIETINICLSFKDKQEEKKSRKHRSQNRCFLLYVERNEIVAERKGARVVIKNIYNTVW